MESYGATQEHLQQCAQRTQRYETATVFQKEIGGKIEIAAMDASSHPVGCELAFYVVVTQAPARAIHLAAYCSQRLQEFKKSYVVDTVALGDGEREIGNRGIYRDEFLIRGRAGE